MTNGTKYSRPGAISEPPFHGVSRGDIRGNRAEESSYNAKVLRFRQLIRRALRMLNLIIGFMFFLNRYTLLVASSSMMLAHFAWTADPTLSGAFSALRAYAIGGRIVLPALVVLALSLTAGGAVVFQEVFQEIADPQSYLPGPNIKYSCVHVVPVLTHTKMTDRDLSADIGRMAVMTATRAIAIAANLIVFAITVYRTFGIKRQARQLQMKVPLTTVLLADGFLYFVVGVRPTMSSVLISRFMFHLHRSPGPAGSTLQATHSLMSSSAGSAPLDSVVFAHFSTDDKSVGAPFAGDTSSAGIALEDDWDDTASDVEGESESNGEGHPSDSPSGGHFRVAIKGLIEAANVSTVYHANGAPHLPHVITRPILVLDSIYTASFAFEDNSRTMGVLGHGRRIKTHVTQTHWRMTDMFFEDRIIESAVELQDT
ncbi:predicted protein [Postia placenta Mad-698-R]|nr:predicted protein [Postia placenta Mad-698-R]